MGQILKISVLVRRLKLSQQQIDELLKADMIKNVKVFHSTYYQDSYISTYLFRGLFYPSKTCVN